ncbi:hypothetical protein RRG49_04520 [Mycoplasmopsis felis]|nr:hypothetical protein [Mycoplasmopsis felis]WAM02251.1 hypothetical protein ONA02_06800 [Mycoplasmopsis felis]WQQ09679.1 hypothetical protein RRG41_01965 [Mycoplasmopsis felis]
MEEFSSWRSKTGKKINVVAPDDFSDSDNKYLNGTSFLHQQLQVLFQF